MLTNATISTAQRFLINKCPKRAIILIAFVTQVPR